MPLLHRKQGWKIYIQNGLGPPCCYCPVIFYNDIFHPRGKTRIQGTKLHGIFKGLQGASSLKSYWFNVRKSMIKKRKIYQFLIILLLVFDLFLNSATAAACFCWGDCACDPLQKENNHLCHAQCTGSACKGCELGKGRGVKAINLSKRTIHNRGFKNLFFNSYLHRRHSSTRKPASYMPLHEINAPVSTPIYLHNLTLII